MTRAFQSARLTFQARSSNGAVNVDNCATASFGPRPDPPPAIRLTPESNGGNERGIWSRGGVNRCMTWEPRRAATPSDLVAWAFVLLAPWIWWTALWSTTSRVRREVSVNVDAKRLATGLDRIALVEFNEALRHNLKDVDLIALSDLLAEESSDRRQAQKEWTGERPIPRNPYWSDR